MTNRLETVQARMAEMPFDWLALIPGPNYYYTTGAPLHPSERLNLLLLPKQGEPLALAPALEAPYLRPLGLKVYEWRDEEGPASALKRMLHDMGVNGDTVGVEYHVMRFGEGQALLEAAPSLRFVAADGFMTSLRAVKDEEEVAAIRKAIGVTERAFQRLLGTIQVGQSELEIAGRLQMLLLEEGADAIAFGPLVVSGPRTAEPHAGASDRVLQPGDVVIIDWGATVDHYSGDITRCLAVEPVPGEIETIYNLCAAANAAGCAAARPGTTGHEVDAASRDVIAAGGYGEYFIHRTGHGMGLHGHEPPYMVAGNHQPLVTGNVFTVEPGIYVPDLGGVRVEDDLRVTEQGSEILTTLPRELIRIPGKAS